MIWLSVSVSVTIQGVSLCSWRMFYGPIVGGLITQNLNFQWADVVQGSLGLLGVSRLLSAFIKTITMSQSIWLKLM